ncbi:amino acid adenylation domain-containing protein [Micromonospora sediminicola]
MKTVTRERGAVESAYPLTALQAGMLYHSEYHSDTATYHDLLTLRVSGRYDPEALRAALTELAVRHPVLRTGFDLTNFSEPMQLVWRTATVPVEEVDLRDATDDVARREVERFAVAERHRPFEWARPPLARVVVHLLPADRFDLTISFHHAILDGWSLSLLVDELLRRYTGHLDGTPLPVVAPSVTFREFVAREKRAVAAPASRDFWARLTADATDGRLPRLPGYPVERGERVDALRTGLDADLVTRLGRLAVDLGVPLRTVLLTAHLRVVALLTGASDAVSGVVTHARAEQEGAQEVLGLFLNSVPLRVDVTAASWSDLVRRVFDAELAVMPHRAFPLFEIQRLAGRDALFDAIFDFRDFHHYRGAADAGPVELLGSETFEQTNLAFAANMIRDPDGVGLSLELRFDAHQFPPEQIAGFRDCYLRALTAMTDDPSASPRPTRPLLDPAHQPPVSGVSRVFGVGSLVDVVGGGGGVVGSWGVVSGVEFGSRVRRLGRLLVGVGVGVDSVVGVCAQRGVGLLVGVLGVVAAGGAYLPLEPSLPDERLGVMVADSGAGVVVTSADLADRVAGVVGVGVRVVVLGEEVGCADGPLGVAVPGEALAYVIYTSGSTGRPKGVGVSHRSIWNRLWWMQDEFGLAADDRVLVKTPFSFDVSVWELFWPSLVGASMVVADPGVHRDSAALLGVVESERVTTVHFVPSMLDAFLAEPGVGVRAAGLRRVFCSGEALGPDVVRRFFEVLPGVELFNLYGPTEAAVDVTWHRCSPGGGVVPIGRPVANTRVEVLDSGLGRVPVGVPGELCIGGVQVGRGYVGRAGWTAERFVPDPFGVVGARLYRTGDVARWRPDGSVEFLGRSDGQVKVRGFRIETGEVEAALVAVPGVRSAVVVARGEGAGVRLVGYVVPEVGVDVSGVDWRVVLGRRLPEYAVPGQVVVIEELPTTVNGKLDRAALPDPGVTRTDHTPPRNPTEAGLVAIWAKLLNVETVGVHDNFFDLGGHSLIALRLAMLVRQEFARELPLASLLAAPTVAQLAEVVAAAPPAVAGAPAAARVVDRVVPLRETGDRPPLFLLHALGGQIFRYRPLAEHLGPDQPVYAIPGYGFAPGEEPIQGLDNMADRYAEHIRAIRPEGPYLLGGFCIGGNIALEVARRLRDGGAEVPLVMPVWSSIEEPVVRTTLESDTQLMIHALAGGLNTVDPEELSTRSPEEQLLTIIQAATQEDTLQYAATEIEEVRRYLAVFRANAHAVGHYTHAPYPGDVVLFMPSEDHDVTPDRDYGWRDLVTGRFAVQPIPGTRFTAVYEPYVSQMAAQMRRWMHHGQPDRTR